MFNRRKPEEAKPIQETAPPPAPARAPAEPPGQPDFLAASAPPAFMSPPGEPEETVAALAPYRAPGSFSPSDSRSLSPSGSGSLSPSGSGSFSPSGAGPLSPSGAGSLSPSGSGPLSPSGSGLTPYQLASLKETPMARSPFAPPLPPVPAAGGLRQAPERTLAPREDGQRRTLVVGRGISVQGTVQDAERLVVEGTMEATMINGLTELSITHGGIFKGEVEVDEAEVAGTIDGTLTARNALIIRASGRVLGTARCRRLQVEDGGQITGRIEMLGDTAPAVHLPAYEAK